MRTLFFLMLLLQTVTAQKDSLLQYCLNRSASELNIPAENIEKYFSRFFDQQNNPLAAAEPADSMQIIYFNIKFTDPPDYNYTSKTINVNFNYIVEDKFCSGSNRNGILLFEKDERIPPKGKGPEKLNRICYILIPDKCSTTRFYNSEGTMFCDNKRQFILEYEEGKNFAENLVIRVGISLLSTSVGNFYEKNFPPQKDYPVDTNIKEYVLRCCIRSIAFLNGDKITDNYVSVK